MVIISGMAEPLSNSLEGAMSCLNWAASYDLVQTFKVKRS